MSDVVLKLENITKIFPNPEQPVVANDKVSIDIRRNEVLALVGENGAGKSTLMNILYGLLAPDEGRIVLDEKPVSFKNPRDAIACGIGMVHQHFMLIPSFTVAENLVFTFEPKKRMLVDKKEAQNIARELSERYGLEIDPAQKIRDCSLSMQQRVEILKILFHGANILIFDEPTAVLTPQEAGELFKAFRQLKESGKSIVFITHKLREVMAVADRATVMRAGKVEDTVKVAESSLEDIAEMMVGRRIDVTRRKVDNREMRRYKKDVILELDELSTAPGPNGVSLDSVSLRVAAGEIVGIAGVGGSGQELVVEAASGLLKQAHKGAIRYRDQDISAMNAHGVRRIGIAHITGERYVRGISTQTNIYDNLIMGFHRRKPWAKKLLLFPGKLQKLAASLIQDYTIKTSSAAVDIMNLSGGNIQKCILARELNLSREFIIAEEPTRGVDIGSIAFIHEQIISKAKEAFGILLVSTDLDEVLSLSNRVLVMFEGRIMGEVDPEESDARKKIGLLMAGVAGEGTVS